MVSMRVCVLVALLGLCMAEVSITAEADAVMAAAAEAAAKAALEAGAEPEIEAGVETVIDETPSEEFSFGGGGDKDDDEGGGGFGASHFDDVPKASFQGKSASLTHGDYTFKYPAWYKKEINSAIGMQPVFQISITKSKETVIYYYILHGPYSNTWVYKGYPVNSAGKKSKRPKFMQGVIPYRVWWRKHCKFSSFTGEYRCQMCFRLDKLTGAMDYGQASATANGYTFSKPVYQVDDEGKAGKFGMMQFTVKKDSSKTMMYILGGPLANNFVSVSKMTGDLKVTKLPIHVYKREYCRDHIGHKACRWCFTFVAYTGMVLPPPSYSITVGSDTVKIHDPQVTQVGLHGGKVHVARYLFNHNNGVHSMYYVIDGKDAGKWFVINRGAGAPLSGSKKKKSAFSDAEDDENEEKIGAKKSLVYITVPLYVYTRHECTKKDDKDHCDWAIRTYKTSDATPSKTMTLGGKKYSNLMITGKPEGGVCEGGCKIITMEKGGAFSSKKYYHSMRGENKNKWFAEGFAGFGKTGIFDKYFLFEYKHCLTHATKGHLCRFCYEFSETSNGFSGTGAASGAVGEKGPVSAGGATLKDPVLEKQVKGIKLGGGGGPGGMGGGGGGDGGGDNKLALPGQSKAQIMSVTVTYNKKTEKYYHIFSGPRAGLWLKTQTVGTRVKRQAIRPTDLPVLVFHHVNCIQGFAGHSCRYCFRMKSRAGLAWTPIGAATTATADKISFKSPRYEAAASPHGDRGKKYKAIILTKDTGMEYIHYMQGPDTGLWYKDGAMGFAKATFTDGGVYSNYDCKMGVTKKICRDCFSFGGTSTAVSGGGVAPDDGDGGAGSDGPEAMPGYTPKFTFGTDTPRCGVKMCKSKDYTKCLWVFYDKCFEKSSIDKAVKSFDNSGKCPFTVYSDCAKKTKKGEFYPGDKKAYDAAQTWRKIVFGSCSASVCAAASYKSCKTITTHKCISEMGISQIMGVKNTGMCPFVLHTTCSTGGTRYQVLPDETKDWGKKTTYTSLRFTPPAAKVCETTGYKTCTTVDSNRYCLEGDTIDANIAAVYNYAPAQMTLYKNCKFDGTSHTLIPGEKKDWGSAQAYSSIKFTPCVARICSKTKFTGCVTITDTTTCLKDMTTSMDNKVMSVINTGSCTLTLYKECTKGTTDTIGPGQARVYGDPTAASWSAVTWTVPKAAPLDFGYWISHTEDDVVPPGGHYFMNDLNHIPLLNKGTYGIVLPDTTIADKKVLYHDKLADVVVMRKTWFHDDPNHVIRLAADTDYCITIATTDNSKDQDIILKTCAKGKYDQWTYDEATQQIKLKENTKRCIKKSASGDKKLKLQLKACATSGDTLDQWGIAKPSSGAKYQLSKAGLLPWKFKNAYAMAAKAEPKAKDINIVFKKYVGDTKDKWHYNTKHYTINSNKYPTIVMRVSGDVKTGTAIKTAVKKYDSKDQWTFDSDNWLIKLKSNTKFCMMKASSGFTEGVNIVLGECGTGSTKEKWGIEEVFTMTSAAITDVKVMNTGHSMWQMKFGDHKHEPVRIKYVLGSDTYYLYYNYAAPSTSTTAKCTASVSCGHLEKWYYIHGAKADATQGKTGTAIAVAKREWIDFPLKVTYSKSNGKYVVRLDCNKCST